MTETYAIVEAGGKQYRVAAGDKIKVNYLGVGEGKEVELSNVLLIADGKDTVVGNPAIENAMVTATCLSEGKGDKVIVFRYKNKTRQRRKTGHRQLLTTLQINDIVKPGGVAAEAKPARKRKAKSGDES
ncbi:50S ribosomal protein L21 [Chloroflexota bacterium]